MPVTAPLYPVGLIVEGRPCLVVGGGRIAQRKAEGLLAAGARVTVVAPAVDAALAALPGVVVHERPYEAADLDGQWLVITATDDPTVTARVHADAERARLWCNAADDPAHCTFTLPAVARRGPITVAVATGGTSPALASWLRNRIEAELGPDVDVLLGLLVEAREQLQAEGRSTESVDWQAALDSVMLELIRTGQVQQARERLQACLSSSSV